MLGRKLTDISNVELPLAFDTRMLASALNVTPNEADTSARRQPSVAVTSAGSERRSRTRHDAVPDIGQPIRELLSEGLMPRDLLTGRDVDNLDEHVVARYLAHHTHLLTWLTDDA